jgi:hypothetical protein
VQSRTHSALESLANIAVGYLVALASQLVVFPMFGIHVPLRTNISIGIWFTAISLVRSYVIRRWFTKRTGGDLTNHKPCPMLDKGENPHEN